MTALMLGLLIITITHANGLQIPGWAWFALVGAFLSDYNSHKKR